MTPRRVLDEIVRRVNPAVPLPLPTSWDGPMETGDVSAYADRTVAAFADTPVPGPSRRLRRRFLRSVPVSRVGCTSLP